MKFVFNTFSADEVIPVSSFIRNKKLSKYYNRETQAAMVSVGMLLKDVDVKPDMPVFYSTGIVEHEEFELNKIAEVSLGGNGLFNPTGFVEKGMSVISPLTQFKVLYNMTLCFISIEYGLRGDNAAMYGSAHGLLYNALLANRDEGIIIGSGKIFCDASVQSGFALVSKNEIREMLNRVSEDEAISIFKYLHEND